MEPWLMEHVGELADRYDYQEAWLDASAAAAGDSWCNDGLFKVCGCPVCRPVYCSEFGEPLPGNCPSRKKALKAILIPVLKPSWRIPCGKKVRSVHKSKQSRWTHENRFHSNIFTSCSADF